MSEDPLRVVAALAGWWWMSNLIVGLLISHDFSTSPVDGTLIHIWFIPISVNGWHVLAHGIAGALGLIAATRSHWSTLYVGTFALAYVAWGSAGLMTDGTLWIFFGDAFGNAVHVTEGVILGLAITATAAARPRTPRPT